MTFAHCHVKTVLTLVLMMTALGLKLPMRVAESALSTTEAKPAILKRSPKTTSGSPIHIVERDGALLIDRTFLPYQTVIKKVRYGSVGRPKLLQVGRKGERVRCYVVLDGVAGPESRTLVSEYTIPAQNAVMLTGERGATQLASRGSFVRKRTLTMTATAYDPGPRSCGPRATGRTAIGMRAGYGVVAVDPRTIPLRSKLYIEGYGYAVAGDTGGAIKGKRIDLGHNSYREALRFGRKKVRVHVLK